MADQQFVGVCKDFQRAINTSYECVAQTIEGLQVIMLARLTDYIQKIQADFDKFDEIEYDHRINTECSNREDDISEISVHVDKIQQILSKYRK